MDLEPVSRETVGCGCYSGSNKNYLRNPNLLPDSVELLPDVRAPVGAHYKSPPEHKPGNVPNSYVLTKVYQHGALLSCCYMDKSEVAKLHMAKTQAAPPIASASASRNKQGSVNKS